MAEPTSMQKMGATPGKLAVVAVLTVILVTAVVLQFGGDGGAGTASERPRRKPGSSASETATTAGAPSANVADSVRHEETRWPKFSLSQIVLHDPFAIPKPMQGADREVVRRSESGVRDEDVARRLQVLTELRGRGVGLVLMGGNGNVATLGSQQIRIGDVINGFKVTDIHRGGIVVTEQDAR